MLILCRLKRDEEAIASFDEALECDPLDTEARSLKGKSLQSLGKLQNSTPSYMFSNQTASSFFSIQKSAQEFGKLQNPPQNKSSNFIPESLYPNTSQQKPWASNLVGNGGPLLLSPPNLFSNLPTDPLFKPQKSAQDYFKQGLTFNVNGNNEKAIENFNEAISLDPKLTKAYYFKGAALVDLGRSEEALEMFDKAISLDPNEATLYVENSLFCRTSKDMKKLLRISIKSLL